MRRPPDRSGFSAASPYADPRQGHVRPNPRTPPNGGIESRWPAGNESLTSAADTGAAVAPNQNEIEAHRRPRGVIFALPVGATMHGSDRASDPFLLPRAAVSTGPIRCPVQVRGQRCIRFARCFGVPDRTEAGLWFQHYDCGEHRVHASVPPHLWWDDCTCDGATGTIS